jgi:hypothetical protein
VHGKYGGAERAGNARDKNTIYLVMCSYENDASSNLSS